MTFDNSQAYPTMFFSQEANGCFRTVIMTTLNVLKDNNSILHFKQNHVGGWVIVILGIGLCYLPQIKPIDENVWIIYCMGGFFILVGLLAAFYRLEIRLNLRQRRYEVIKGFWPNPEKYRGTFEHIEGLWFKKQWHTSSGKNKSKYLVWQTCLKFNFDKKPICLHESRDESEALAYFEKRAKQLKIKTFDHTGDTPKERSWEELDAPVSEQLPNVDYQAVDISSPPQGLIFKKEPHAATYLLPKPGVNSTSFVGCLFGLPFFLMGIFATIISMGLHEKIGWSINVSGSMSAAFILGIIFALIGGFIIKFSIDYAFTTYQFSFNKNEFLYTTFTYGHLKEEKRYPFSQIEEFDLRESTERQTRSRYRIAGAEISKFKKSDKQELFIRTNTEVIKVRELKADISRFLKNVFYQNLEQNHPSQQSLSNPSNST